jgi:hypothetical protein
LAKKGEKDTRPQPEEKSADGDRSAAGSSAAAADESPQFRNKPSEPSTKAPPEADVEIGVDAANEAEGTARRIAPRRANDRSPIENADRRENPAAESLAPTRPDAAVGGLADEPAKPRGGGARSALNADESRQSGVAGEIAASPRVRVYFLLQPKDVPSAAAATKPAATPPTEKPD